MYTLLLFYLFTIYSIKNCLGITYLIIMCETFQRMWGEFLWGTNLYNARLMGDTTLWSGITWDKVASFWVNRDACPFPPITCERASLLRNCPSAVRIFEIVMSPLKIPFGPKTKKILY
uniref:Uncharacterized protein n=1 Tax=Cacopsylla melanoneura TaxID=428564 RepID=A0A8D8SSB6_9HEMI